ncbi:MAG: hypothetical protein GF313_07730, partial [Caldithrix sp.]|nr:hypothetical protein [Caldithrix sp.]
MENPQRLLRQLDHFILEALRFSYNKAMKAPVFARSYDSIAPFAHHPKNILRLPNKQTNTKIWRYRLPQSRIYVDFIDYNEGMITVIDYFKVWLVYDNNTESNLLGRCSLSIEKGRVLAPEGQDQAGGFSQTKFSDLPLVAVSEDNTLNEISLLPEKLSKYYHSECRNHPLFHVSANNETLLKNIDEHWAQLKIVEQAKQIGSLSTRNISVVTLICILELYLHLGWRKTLNKFFEQNLSNVETDLYNISAVRKWFNRFDMDLSEQSENHETSIDPNAITEVTNFTSQFFNPGRIERQEKINLLQDHWEYISLPAVRINVHEAIRQQPLRYLCFTLLAMEENMRWADKWYTLYVEFLDAAQRAAMELLVSVKKIMNICLDKNGMLVSEPWLAAPVVSLKDGSLISYWKSVHQGSVRKTAIEIGQNLSVTIDRKVQMHIDSDQKTVTIVPLTYGIPFVEEAWHIVTI